MTTLPKKRKLSENEAIKSTFVASEKLLGIEYELCSKLQNLKFTSPVEYIYNPLKYAKELHETFVKKFFEKSTKKILFLGINPGPWGMCQNGIVFGERDHVKEWLKITGSVEKPDQEHPKKKIMGLNCHRSEISGKKFWAFFKTICGTPEGFFKHSFVHNICPLAFMDGSGKNITPPEIKNKATKQLLNDICDEAFIKVVKEFKFEVIIGIGRFAEERAKKALGLCGITNIRVKSLFTFNITKILSIPHPSPRNAKNFSNWEQTTFKILQDHSLIKYFKNENIANSVFLTKENDAN